MDLKPWRCQLIDEYAGDYCQAVDDGEAMLEELGRMGQTPEADALKAKIARQKELVEDLRLEFNQNYGPESSNAHIGRRRRVHSSKAVFSLAKLRELKI